LKSFNKKNKKKKQEIKRMVGTQQMIRVKAKIFDQHRRFTVTGFQELVDQLNKYNTSPTREYFIYYKDSEGDWVIVEDFNEWNELIRQHTADMVLNIELRRKFFKIEDYVQEKADVVREKVIHHQQAIRNNEKYQETKEKIDQTFNTVIKTLEQGAETGKEVLNDMVKMLQNLYEEAAASTTSTEIQAPAYTPIQQEFEQEQKVEVVKVQPPPVQAIVQEEVKVQEKVQVPEQVPVQEPVQQVTLLSTMDEAEQEAEVVVEKEEEKEPEELNMLGQMGFNDNARNKELLAKHNNNLSLVVSTLLREKNN